MAFYTQLPLVKVDTRQVNHRIYSQRDLLFSLLLPCEPPPPTAKHGSVNAADKWDDHGSKSDSSDISSVDAELTEFEIQSERKLCGLDL